MELRVEKSGQRRQSFSEVLMIQKDGGLLHTNAGLILALPIDLEIVLCHFLAGDEAVMSF